MPRNLDLTALRSFVTVAETGGVTRAAHQLNLTQSAVSMQLKRLEESLGLSLLSRSGRGVQLTNHGEQLVSYGRRMLALNDEVLTRMTDKGFEGEVRLGVPSDIVYPHIPSILKRFDREFPRVKINLYSSYTTKLKQMMADGEVDLILTTERSPDAGGVILTDQRLVWVGVDGGTAWRGRPLRLAFEEQCLFRPWATKALDDAGIAWEMAVETTSTRTVEASVSADLAVHAMLEMAVGHVMKPIEHGHHLPDLPNCRIALYRAPAAIGAPIDAMESMLQMAYRDIAAVA
ncbi:LysR family transcriptional regulator [Rhodobacteraceae bacterium NNCM2]|nr:LysR family transcriptional regulator [Coraliihabitans acroporae]